jgi:hypothetical protein
MTAPRQVSRKQLQTEPFIVWNAYISLLARSDCQDLSETQRRAQLVFWYEQEVQNGGHLQYFENHGTDRVTETIDALRCLGAHCQADVLARAVARFSAKPRARSESAEQYVEKALQGEFDSFDRSFAECELPLPKVLERFLEQNRAEFVEIVD